MVVCGGGDQEKILDGISSFAKELKTRLENNMPFVAWNEGAEIACMNTFNSTGTANGPLGILPFQFMFNYSDTPEKRKSIEDFLKANGDIWKAAASGRNLCRGRVAGYVWKILIQPLPGEVPTARGEAALFNLSALCLYLELDRHDQIVEVSYDPNNLQLIP